MSSIFLRFFDRIDGVFEAGNYRTADEALFGLLELFNKECEEKGLYRDREGNPLTMQMNYVENYHDLRDIFKLELDVVDFEDDYKKLSVSQQKKIIELMVSKLFDLSKTMQTISHVTSDDPELEDISVIEYGISISYKIKNYGTNKEEYVVESYGFPNFQRNDFLGVAKESKEKVQALVDEKVLFSAMKNQSGG